MGRRKNNLKPFSPTMEYSTGKNPPKEGTVPQGMRFREIRPGVWKLFDPEAIKRGPDLFEGFGQPTQIVLGELLNGETSGSERKRR